MQDISGTWRFTQQWGSSRPFSFEAIFSNGTINVNGQYFGAYTVLWNSNQIALAISNFSEKTIVSYSGNLIGDVMGGQATGAWNIGATQSATWSAVKIQVLQAETKEFYFPK